jgi:4-amino-4-deoxy-L-arabinose transferase-like glycosyltransferase
MTTPAPPTEATASSLNERRWNLVALGLTAVLLFIYAVASHTAVRTKSGTWDEPWHHALNAYMIRFEGDYRFGPEAPAGSGWLLSIGADRQDVHLDRAHPTFKAMPLDIERWNYIRGALYNDPQSRPNALVERARRASLITSVLTGMVMAVWAWRLGGRVAMVVAVALFAFDATCLGHGGLATSDVLAAGAFAVTMWCTWELGRRGSVRWAIALLACCGLAVVTKFSGVLFPLVAGMALGVRAVIGGAWPLGFGTVASKRAARLATVAVLGIAMGLACYATIWACYRFRFEPAPPDRSFARDTLGQLVQRDQAKIVLANSLTGGAPDTLERRAAQRPQLSVRLAQWMHERRLLPEAWLVGYVYVAANAHARDAFLLGEQSKTGWWYYFPLAMVVKTPVATLLLGAGLAVAWAVSRLARRPRWLDPWSTLCLALPVACYGLMAMRGNLNIGIRHILPVYPFLFVAMGVGAARVVAMADAAGRWAVAMKVLGGLGVCLVAETMLAWPHFIAFFNVPAGGSRGGLELLSDSNLDWGQDLPLLVEWQRQNPGEKLYLSYFGSVDPNVYGIRHVPLPTGWPWGTKSVDLREPGVFAISATNLQGIYMPPEWAQIFKALRQQKPLDVLGGTIYLYRYAGQR